jgi:AraC-like DNA-binding protein
MAEHTMSMRLVQPFVKVMQRKGFDPKLVRFLQHADPDARILTSSAVALLRVSVEMTRDEGLGLLAALETTRGDYGDLEYAAGSCATVGEALEFVHSHYFVLDDATSYDSCREHGRLRISVLQPLELACRAVIDFTLGMMYLSHLRWVAGDPSDFEIWFTYPRPADLSVHERIFGRARLRFDAPESALSFPECALEYPLRHSDPQLHQLLVRYLRDRYRTRGLSPSLIDTARTYILEELEDGRAKVDHIAQRLGMSRRTLCRKLEEEGTSFKRLLNDVRCARAVHFLLLDAGSIHQISDHLGYSEPAAFHRAFRSWFGATPAEYREQQRRRWGSAAPNGA